jgi:hypothetical protein
MNAVMQGLSTKQIEQIKHALFGDTPAVLIRGLPIDSPLPATPADGYIDESKIPVSLALLLGLYELLKLEIIFYPGENIDRTVRHVVPSISAVQERSSHGSRFTFGMHVDNPHLQLIGEPGLNTKQYCPEFLCLLSMRTQSDVYTNMVFLNDILALLPINTIKTLSKPLYNVKWPDSFGSHSNDSLQPVIFRDELGIYRNRFDLHNVTGINAEARDALGLFGAIAQSETITHQVLLLPGDLLIFNNQRSVHSREGFSPRCNGMDRWLIRLFGIRKSHLLNGDKNK